MDKRSHTASVPAFPSGDFSGVQPVNGLTKRELFAAMIMQGFSGLRDSPFASQSMRARQAVQWADALLDALSDETQLTSRDQS